MSLFVQLQEESRCRIAGADVMFMVALYIVRSASKLILLVMGSFPKWAGLDDFHTVEGLIFSFCREHILNSIDQRSTNQEIPETTMMVVVAHQHKHDFSTKCRDSRYGSSYVRSSGSRPSWKRQDNVL
jgi:hypothetical protein